MFFFKFINNYIHNINNNKNKNIYNINTNIKHVRLKHLGSGNQARLKRP